MRIIGVDPGLDGAMVVVYDNAKRMTGFHFPKAKASSGRGYQSLWHGMVPEVGQFCWEADHAFIEDVGVMPKEGASAGFKFGYVAGGIRGMIAMCRVPITMVKPAAWKSSMKLTRKDKSVSIARAQELFPQDVELLKPERGVRTSKQVEGIAEAALIGYHGYQIMRNNHA